MPRSDLPAPYVSPWRLLGRDLQAVAAWLGLKLRELGRRNNQSDLPLPAFWPRAAAPLFWPLVLAAGLLLVALTGRWLAARAPEPPVQAGPSASTSPVSSSPDPTTPPAPPIGRPSRNSPSGTAGDLASLEPGPGSGDSGTAASGTPPPAARTGRPAGTEPGPPSSTLPAPQAPPSGEASTGEAGERGLSGRQAGSPTEDPSADPEAALFPLVEEDDPDHLLERSEVKPEDRLLVLRVGAAFAGLEEPRRGRWAERWRRRAEILGYERLELRDGADRLLGRTALVGSGMILLDPDSRPR